MEGPSGFRKCQALLSKLVLSKQRASSSFQQRNGGMVTKEKMKVYAKTFYHSNKRAYFAYSLKNTYSFP